MMGKILGVATGTKKELNKNELAIYCHPHALNLACGDSIKNCKPIQKAFQTRITADNFPHKGIVY